jgi:G protein beta subunit-like protein
LNFDAKSTLATCSADHTIKLWKTNNGLKLDKILTGHERWVWDCAFSADSAYLISGKRYMV